jgi:ankyrin repeat protein
MFTASRWGRKDIVEILLSKGGDVNFTNNDGSTPLHFGE